MNLKNTTGLTGNIKELQYYTGINTQGSKKINNFLNTHGKMTA